MIGRFLKLVTLSLMMIAAAAVPVFAQQIVVQHLRDGAHGQEWTDWIEEAQKKFEAANPDIRIEVLTTGGRAEQMDRITAMYASGILPDVIEVVPQDHYQFAANGVLKDLSSLVERDSEIAWDEFFPASVNATEIRTGDRVGVRWFLPVSIWTVGAAFNLDHFNEAGLAAPSSYDHHWTWEEFRDLAQKLTRRDADGNVTRYGARVTNWWGRWPVWVHNAGGYLFDQYVIPTASRLNSEEVITALTFLQDLYQSGIAHWEGAGVAEWMEQRSSMNLDAGPAQTRIHQLSEETFEFSYGPNPRLVRGGSENVSIGVAMNAESDNAEAAWRWMKFLATEAAADHIAYTGRPVPYGPVARNYEEYFQNPSPWEHVWIELISSPESYERPILPPGVADRLGYVSSIFNGTEAVGTVVERMHSEAEAIFRDYYGD